MNGVKTAVILGASSGIGREMALYLAGQGWRVGITGRRENLLRETAALFPDAIAAQPFDMDDTEALSGRLDDLAERLGGVDLVVISAGCGFINENLATEPELRTARTNVLSFTVAAAWAYAYFGKRGGGHLAAITSVGGLIGEGLAPAYPASKAYQILYLDSLRKRAKKERANIRITELRPGSVDTDMMKGEGHFWISTPRDAAELACAAIIKGKRLQYISRRWRIVGTLLRFFSLSK